jgi:DNA (cytosine-5)-methyltransferase 1
MPIVRTKRKAVPENPKMDSEFRNHETDDRTMPPRAQTGFPALCRRPSNGIRVASFFSGGGGLDIGFHLAGFDIVYATDIEPLFCQTLKANRGRYLDGNAVAEPRDIRDLQLGELPDKIDFVIGGPPCQSFSASGRRAGGAAGQLDPRGTLFHAYCRVIAGLRPKGFLFENVRGILGTHKGRDWEAIVAAFGAIGYSLAYRILDACDFGIPQRRERMFLVGKRDDTPFLFPKPQFGPDSGDGRPHATPREAFRGIAHDENLKDLYLSDGRYAHLLPEVPPGQNYLYFTVQRGYPKPVFAYRSRFSDFLYKAHPDQPVKTLIASPGKYTGPLHWDNRYFSVAEYKRLQGFPDDYTILGNRSERIRQIGNSVSPAIAFPLARSIAKQVFGLEEDLALLPADCPLSFDRRKGEQARKTREYHRHVAANEQNHPNALAFQLQSYDCRVEPTTFKADAPNVRVRAQGRHAILSVRSDPQRELLAKLLIEFKPGERATLFPSEAEATLEVSLYGGEDHSIQTMWNAVDDLVIRCSGFHSLIEMYGHFTEPHPNFRIVKFERYSENPVAKFAEHIADFNNCSRYFPKSHLVELFGAAVGSRSFPEIADFLRRYRFDVRSRETNIAIPDRVYMVAYPFTLPPGKQMNFHVHRNRRRSEGAVQDPTAL